MAWTHLWEPDHTNGEDECPNKLDTRGDTPSRVVIAVLCRVVDDGGEEETDGDRPLVARDDGTTNPLGGTLGLVHGDEGRDETDTETGAHTADNEGGPLVAAGLEGHTEGEDEGGEEDTTATTEGISNVCTSERT